MKHTEVSSDVKKPDRRVIKTKRAIRNAFAALIAEKDLNDITIKDISDVADINRKTVYNYYGGIHEILDEIENELVSSFEKVIQEIDFPRNLENPNKIFETLTDVINEDMEFYSQLMLKIRVKQTLAQRLPADKKKIELIADFITSGMLSAYQSWFNSGREQPIAEFSKEVSVLVFSGVNGLIGK